MSLHISRTMFALRYSAVFSVVPNSRKRIGDPLYMQWIRAIFASLPFFLVYILVYPSEEADIPVSKWNNGTNTMIRNGCRKMSV